ncbi:hypothetical protein MTBUT4_540001 [Magnetospirillum sp. UT-4]|nr:hypothetical protein MTBUT4_540001 [Magnetospirillum sp. UT-4]
MRFVTFEIRSKVTAKVLKTKKPSPPLRGRVGVGGNRVGAVADLTPPPTPPHQGEGSKKGGTPPHQGEGSKKGGTPPHQGEGSKGGE